MTAVALPGAGLRRELRWHPRAWRGPSALVALATVAWLVLLAMLVPGLRAPGMPSMSMPGNWVHGSSPIILLCRLAVPAHSSAGNRLVFLGAGGAGSIGMWAMMIVAMMLPTTLPVVRHVGHNSLCWRRRRAMALFVIAYLAVWLAVGAAVILSAQWWSGLAGTALSAGALLGAAAWQLTPQKRAALAACHRPRPLPPRGLTAEAGSVRFGLMNGYACLRSCWAMMIPMAIAGSASIAWMIALSAIVMTEKRALRPRHTTRVIAGVLACSATLVAVLGGSTL